MTDPGMLARIANAAPRLIISMVFPSPPGLAVDQATAGARSQNIAS